MKSSFNLKINNSLLDRGEIKNFYLNKYFNLFMNAYEWTGIDEQQKDFIMRKFWSVGSVACYKLPYMESEENPEGVVIFTPYATAGYYNIYDYPTKVTLINTRGVKFIPTKPLEINKDVVIGFIQRNKKGVLSSIESKIEQLVDVEMVIRTNLVAHKMPLLVAVNPENEFKIKNIFNKLMNDEPALFVGIDDARNFTNLVAGAPYIIDKLKAYANIIEGEILTILGVDNIGIMEKKEHLDVDEVNANNDLINAHADNFTDSLKEFTSLINDVLGYKINVEPKFKPVTATSEGGEESGENEAYND